MSMKPHVRRVFVFFCLAALLLAALTPGAAGLPLAILVTLWFFIAVVVSVPLPHIDEQGHKQQDDLAVLALSPRPPPAL